MALYHTAKGSVDYTVVGSPTIVNGVVSDFVNNTNYLTIDTVIPFQTADTWEIKTAFVAKEGNGTDWQDLIVFAFSTNDGVKILLHPSNKHIFVGVNNDKILWKDFLISYNTLYYLKLQFTGLAYILSISTDNVIWNEVTRVETTTKTNNSVSNRQTIGVNGSYTYSRMWYGSIDLNETYIKINGQPWFGVCPVEVKKVVINKSLPSGYTQLSYLQGDATAYIETPVVPTDTTGMKIVFEYGTAGGSGAICGTFNGVSPRKDTFFVSTNSGTVDTTWAFIAQAGSTLTATNSEVPVAGKTYTALINYKNSRTYGFEGFTQQSIGSNGVLANKVLLFARLNIANNNITASDCKIKYVEFTEGSATTYIYIPAKYNNTLGLYDKITGAFLTNTNTSGSFTSGADTGAVNYLIKDGKLVFADPRIYLTGQKTYTITEESGTITDIQDGIFTRTINSPILSRDVTSTEWANFHTQDWEMGSYVDLTGLDTDTISNNFVCVGSKFNVKMGFIENRTFYGVFNNESSTVFVPYLGDNPIPSNISNMANGPRWLKFSKQGTTVTISMSADNNTWYSTSWYNIVGSEVEYRPLVVGQTQALNTDKWVGAKVDLKQTYIKLNGQLWFYGKNYATQNISPVPANYTYGTTTTSAIGYVDMRTQAFTPAPSGATIGRDE
jgi:hypothetical protein